MHTIITGGTGLIGRALAQSLLADGHSVTVLSRNPVEVTDMPAGVQLRRWDGKSAAGWGELVDGADAIVNLAGANIGDKRWSASRKQLVRNSRLDAAQAVLEAVRQAHTKPKVLVQASAVGYYGAQTGDLEVDESFANGADFVAKVCHDHELATAPIMAEGVRRVVVRSGVVLSNEGGAFPRLKLPFSFFAGGKLGDGRQWLPWIHIDDEVRAMRFLIEQTTADGAFNLVAPKPVTNEEMAKALGAAMGRPAMIPAPGFALKLVLGEMSTMVLDGQRVVPKRLLELGFVFRYATVDAALGNLVRGAAPEPAKAAA